MMSGTRSIRIDGSRGLKRQPHIMFKSSINVYLGDDSKTSYFQACHFGP